MCHFTLKLTLAVVEPEPELASTTTAYDPDATRWPLLSVRFQMTLAEPLGIVAAVSSDRTSLPLASTTRTDTLALSDSEKEIVPDFCTGCGEMTRPLTANAGLGGGVPA